ncbi:TIGR03118 family protein [Edaphobacter aggregans]|uniref:TIGR03118 family protein n=1 Tax=Edaphobacter aggregans TaxID=570835 RepID=UPI000A00CC1B|nr:TIGR03118 family protein [Edaphobacter aggregans]
MRNAILVVLASVLGLQAAAQSYKVTNIISDGSVPAATIDANFLNPWAISTSPTWWISAANTGYNYVVQSSGAVPFKVIVPSASGAAGSTGEPAGSVTTAGTVGMLLPNGVKASFLFSTLDGTISGWNNRLGMNLAVSQIAINNSSAGAVYPGMAILNIASGGVTTQSYILAANFGAGNAIEVYDSNFKPTKLAGTFTDTTLPPGYAPWSVHVLGTQVFVAYALRTPDFEEVLGSGNGIVNVFDTSGNFVARVVTFGNLNAPWGVAIAPANFGIFSNDLLIGNRGDGKINVYDPKTFAYLGQLMDSTGKPLTYDSLWELLPGGTAVTGTTAVSGGDTSTVYFTAGLANEAHGLFAGITNSTTPGSTATFGFSTSAGAATIPAGSSTTATVSVAPANGFSGSVSLACNGLPAGASCSFSPASLNVTANAVATGTVTIQTSTGAANLRPARRQNMLFAGVASALLLPFASLMRMRRRRAWPHLLCAVLVCAAAGGFISGCGDDSKSTPLPPTTPAGQSTVSITATSGSITQTSSFALTVQ